MMNDNVKAGVLYVVDNEVFTFANVYTMQRDELIYPRLEYTTSLKRGSIVILLTSTILHFDGEQYALIACGSACGWIWIEKIKPIR